MRWSFLLLFISLIIVGCQSEGSFTGKVHGVNVLQKKLSISVDKGERIQAVDLIMVELPGSDEKEQIDFARKAMDFLKNEVGQYVTVTVKFVESPEKEGYPAPGFAYHNNEDVAIGLLKKGYLKVDKDSKYVKKYPEKFQQYLEAERESNQ